MKSLLIAAAAAAALAIAGGASAATGPEVLKAKGCENCHAQDTKKVGPAWKDIAAKKPDINAEVAKLKEGKGHPKINASDEELKAAVTYVVTGK